MLPTLLDLLGAEVPLQCDGRPLTGFLDGSRDVGDEPAWREETHFEFDFRDAGSDLLERVRPDARGVLDRGAARRPRQVRPLRRPAPDLLRSRHRSRADREPRRRPRVRAVGARVRATHALVAHAAPGTHAHRHEAHRSRRARRAPRRADRWTPRSSWKRSPSTVSNRSDRPHPPHPVGGGCRSCAGSSREPARSSAAAGSVRASRSRSSSAAGRSCGRPRST